MIIIIMKVFIIWNFPDPTGTFQSRATPSGEPWYYRKLPEVGG